MKKLIDKIFILKANTEVFSIELQESIKFSNDVYVKITNTIIGNNDSVFACLQVKLHNLLLGAYLQKDMSTFVDKIHGNITTSISNLTPIVNNTSKISKQTSIK